VRCFQFPLDEGLSISPLGAKRIGLLFSEAQIDWKLDPKYITDIPDIRAGDELFSDGCGLISRRLAMQLSKSKRIIFRSVRYTPCVFQIRFLHLSLSETWSNLLDILGTKVSSCCTLNLTPRNNI